MQAYDGDASAGVDDMLLASYLALLWFAAMVAGSSISVLLQYPELVKEASMLLKDAQALRIQNEALKRAAHKAATYSSLEVHKGKRIALVVLQDYWKFVTLFATHTQVKELAEVRYGRLRAAFDDSHNHRQHLLRFSFILPSCDAFNRHYFAFKDQPFFHQVLADLGLFNK